MTTKSTVHEFIEALQGGKGKLDAWLEVNDEAQVREAMLGALAEQKANIAAWIEPQRNDVPASGIEFAAALRAAPAFFAGDH